MTTFRFAAAVLAVAMTVLEALAGAQTTPPPALSDARWAAWLGCWRAADDLSTIGTRVCIVPAAGGVTLRTIVGGQMVGEELRVAGGAPRPVREAGCTGTETASWSADGQRAYRTAQASCGAEPVRTLASASYFVPGPIWVEVQTVSNDGGTNVRVSRYVRAANQKLVDGTTAPLPPAGVAGALVSRGWTTDEIVEVSRVLPPEGVQAAISEGPTAFRLNAKSLTGLADGGVAENVIDLMVALTYPEKFTIDRSTGWGGGSSGLGIMGGGIIDPFFAQVIGPAALFDCNGAYGWAWSGYWSRCAGYDRLGYYTAYYTGYYNGFYGGNGPYGAWIPVNTGPATPGGTPDGAQGGGRLVNGRGYTQVRPVDTSIVGQQTADRSNGGAQSTSGSSGSTSSGATSSGYSGGSSMGSGGGGGDRMAMPRPPGGGA